MLILGIESTCDETGCAIVRDGRQVVVVTSGAIALGSRALGWERPGRSIPEMQAAAAVGQIDLVDRRLRCQPGRPLQGVQGRRGVAVAQRDEAAQAEELGPRAAVRRQLVEKGGGLGQAVALEMLERLLKLAIDIGCGRRTVGPGHRRSLVVAAISHPPPRRLKGADAASRRDGRHGQPRFQSVGPPRACRA